MATEAELKQALLTAHKKGDKRAADLFAAKIKEMRLAAQTPAESIPIFDDQGNPIEADIPGANKPEQASALNFLGPAEAIATVGSGAASSLYGAGKGLVDSFTSGAYLEGKGPDVMEQQIIESTREGTYVPKTPLGQKIVSTIGKVGENLPPVIAGFSPAQLAAAGQSAKMTAQVAPTLARESAQVAKQAVQNVMPQSSSARSMGAAEVGGGLEAQRIARAEALPVPVKLTKGQATQDFAQQQFERETAKQAEEGAPIRQRMQEQNQALVQSFDAFLDDIGTELPETAYKLQTGQKIDEALRKRAAVDKARIRSAYKAADEAGETAEPVSLSGVADYLNSNRAEAGLAPIMQAVSKQLEVQGVGGGSLLDGTLQVGDMTLAQAERLRKAINKFSSGADANNLRVAGELKQLIDDATEGAGGERYQAARKLRKQYGDNYERIGIVKNILGTKRGSNDRQIALENIVDKVVTNGSVDDLAQVRRLLQTQGREGMSAWREMQASTIRHIRDEATKGVGRDPNGNPLISPAQLNRTISALDKNGKLEKVFGKKGSEQLKDMNDIAKDVFVAQPGAVNTSNTSSALLAAMDMMMTAGAGVPTPILSGLKITRDSLRKRKVDKKVQEALR